MSEQLPGVNHKYSASSRRKLIAVLALTAAAATGCGTAKAIGGSPTESPKPPTTTATHKAGGSIHNLCEVISKETIAKVMGSNNPSSVEKCSNPELLPGQTASYEWDVNIGLGSYVNMTVSTDESLYSAAEALPDSHKVNVKTSAGNSAVITLNQYNEGLDVYVQLGNGQVLDVNFNYFDNNSAHVDPGKLAAKLPLIKPFVEGLPALG